MINCWSLAICVIMLEKRWDSFKMAVNISRAKLLVLVWRLSWESWNHSCLGGDANLWFTGIHENTIAVKQFNKILINIQRMLWDQLFLTLILYLIVKYGICRSQLLNTPLQYWREIVFRFYWQNCENRNKFGTILLSDIWIKKCWVVR